MSLIVKEWFDTGTCTITYLVHQVGSPAAIVIDPILNFNPASGKLSLESIDAIKSYIKTHKLELQLILETHAHADHLSGADQLRQLYPKAKLGIGAKICEVQELFSKVYGLGDACPADGSQFDYLYKDGAQIQVGSMAFKVITTPGHTPACVSYVFDHFVFTGDTLFMPDFGTGRCDFPGGNAHQLYHSVHNRLYNLDEALVVYTGHDYQPGGRAFKFASTIKAEKAENIHIKPQTTETEFVSFRTRRDAQLDAPKLLHPSIQINIQGGRLPQAEAYGKRFLKIPLSF